MWNFQSAGRTPCCPEYNQDIFPPIVAKLMFFTFDKAVAMVASNSKIPPSKYKLNASAIQPSSGQKVQSATVSLKQIDVVKFAEFLSKIQLRWANLQCNRVKLTQKPGLPDIWDVDIEFKYYY